MKGGLWVFPLLLGLASAGQGGDYGLTVADDPNSPCARPGQPRTPSWPVVSGAEIGRDVARYFGGQETQVGLFGAAFGNGAVTFCGARERGEVYDALIQVATTGPKANGSHLYDFALTLGSKQLLDIIDVRLQDAALPQTAARRLRRMREAAERGMMLRHEGPT